MTLDDLLDIDDVPCRPPRPAHGYAALGAAVVRQALDDLESPQEYQRRTALAWLLGDGPVLWASVAGVDLEALRERVRHRAGLPRGTRRVQWGALVPGAAPSLGRSRVCLVSSVPAGHARPSAGLRRMPRS